MPFLETVARYCGVTPGVFCTIFNRCAREERRRFFTSGLSDNWNPYDYLDTYVSDNIELREFVRDHLREHRIHNRGQRTGRHHSLEPNISTTIRSSPNLSENTASISSIESRSLPAEEIGIGADPEFEVWDTAQNRSRSFNHGTTHSEVGIDGDGCTGELRPTWNRNPSKVFDKINKLLDTVEQ